MATTLAPSETSAQDTTRLTSRAWQLLGESHGRKARQSGLLAQAGLAKKARGGFEKAAEVDPDNLEVKRNLVEFYTRAPAFMGGGKDKALEQIEEISKRDRARGAEALGLHHRWLEQTDEALAAYDQALAIREDWATPHYEAAVALRTKSRHDEAARRLADALETDTNHRMAQFDLGALAAEQPSVLAQANLAQATAALQSYVSRPACGEDPPVFEAHLNLARIHEHQGALDAARSSYERVIELQPTHRAATRALKRLVTQ